MNSLSLGPASTRLMPTQLLPGMGQFQSSSSSPFFRSNVIRGTPSGNTSSGRREETARERETREAAESSARTVADQRQQIEDQRRQIEAQRTAAPVGGGASGGGFNLQSGFGDLTKQAKELAEFNLGLNQKQGTFDFDLRNREFDNNTGRQQRINEQQNKWQSDLNRDTQEAQTKRLGLQIEGQDRQQRTGIDQENFATDRAVRLASRRLGE